MAIIPPYWFAQRQGKAEEAGPNLYRLTGPNLPETFIGIRPAANHWQAYLRVRADGPDEVVSPPDLPTTYDAWEAAFEIYRNKVIN
jgi:hypothetical protein